MNRNFLFACLLLGISTTVWSADARKPNILILLSDDVGWGEYGFQGAKDIPTPNIDSIASGGIRFPQAYNAATYCSPTRAGLMSGHYPTRFGHEFNTVVNNFGLVASETTIAQRLKAQGYSTGVVGKWHLGNGLEYRPTNRGFDEFFGTLANTPFFHPKAFVDSRLSLDTREVTDDNFYTTDAYAERAVNWIETHKDQPWFLYLPFNAQHAPLQAPQKYLDRFPNISDEKRRMFSAAMSAMDDAVGRVLSKVRELKQEENTLIVFFSDNGGPTAGTTSRNGPLRGFKQTTFEGGVRVPFCMQWKGHLPSGTIYDKPIIQLDLYPTCIAAAGGQVDPAWKLDGVNLLPYLTGKTDDKPHETLYWRFGEQWAVRHGDWKLVVGKGGSGKPELYDLIKDLGESKDLAAAEPTKVAELQTLWNKWNAEQAAPLAPLKVTTTTNTKNTKKNTRTNQKKNNNSTKSAASKSDA